MREGDIAVVEIDDRATSEEQVRPGGQTNPQRGSIVGRGRHSLIETVAARCICEGHDVELKIDGCWRTSCAKSYFRQRRGCGLERKISILVDRNSRCRQNVSG